MTITNKHVGYGLVGLMITGVLLLFHFLDPHGLSFYHGSFLSAFLSTSFTSLICIIQYIVLFFTVIELLFLSDRFMSQLLNDEIKFEYTIFNRHSKLDLNDIRERAGHAFASGDEDLGNKILDELDQK